MLPPSWKVQSVERDWLRIFGRLQQTFCSDPTRKWTLLVIWRKALLKNKLNKCVREFEVIALKGSHMAQNKSHQSRAQEKRAESSKAQQSGNAGN